MADTMQFDLVSPERRLASLQAREVRIPGADGDLTAMPDHAALITTLRPGVLSVVTPEGTKDYAVTGGFAEITAAGTSVLAERAVPTSEMTADLMGEFLRLATDAAGTVQPGARDDADKLVADRLALKAALGL
jgi:F-type H+-transporting ATPase subunit epsilon